MEEVKETMAILDSLQLVQQMGEAIIMFELMDPLLACSDEFRLPSPAKP